MLSPARSRALRSSNIFTSDKDSRRSRSFSGNSRAMMPTTWKDGQISHELKKMGQASAENALFDRVLFRIETRLESRKKHFWNSITWKPWAHPGSWMAIAACFCVTVTGALYHLKQTENADLDTYMINLSNPTANVNQEMDGIKVPILLSDEPHAETTNILLSDEDRSEILSDI
jgi:hypothetical protein